MTLIGFTVRFLKEDDRPKVVVVVKESDSEYWRIFESGAKRAFDDFDVNGKVDEPSLHDRIKGAKEALEEVCIEIVTEQSGHNEKGQVKSVMGIILQRYPDIKGIIAAHDLIALDALRVIEKKEAEIPVIGADGLVDMVEYIEKGKLSAALAQNPYDMAYLSVEQSLKAIKGEYVQKKIDSGVDIITQDNAKDKLDFLKGILNLE